MSCYFYLVVLETKFRSFYEQNQSSQDTDNFDRKDPENNFLHKPGGLLAFGMMLSLT